MYHFLKEQGIPCENDLYKPEDVTIFSFPIKSPRTACIRKNISAIGQLKLWKIYNEYWCEHKPSITVYVRDEEWMEVGAWVWKHFDEISGISFLPYDTGTYKQAPYQEIDEDDYLSLVEKVPKSIDWSRLGEYEKDDKSCNRGFSFACSGDKCEVVDIQ